MGNMTNTSHHDVSDRAASRRATAIAAGDRGAAVLAAWERWDRLPPPRPTDEVDPRIVMVSHRLWQRLGKLIVRIRGTVAQSGQQADADTMMRGAPHVVSEPAEVRDGKTAV